MLAQRVEHGGHAVPRAASDLRASSSRAGGVSGLLAKSMSALVTVSSSSAAISRSSSFWMVTCSASGIITALASWTASEAPTGSPAAFVNPSACTTHASPACRARRPRRRRRSWRRGSSPCPWRRRARSRPRRPLRRGTRRRARAPRRARPTARRGRRRCGSRSPRSARCRWRARGAAAARRGGSCRAPWWEPTGSVPGRIQRGAPGSSRAGSFTRRAPCSAGARPIDVVEAGHRRSRRRRARRRAAKTRLVWLRRSTRAHLAAGEGDRRR